MKFDINKIVLLILILFIDVLLNIINKISINIIVDINHKNNYLSTQNISNNIKYINSSRDYWENRYKKGGNSGAGSYNNLAAFKAKVINNFVTENNINTVLELGSGDCNQLSYANYKKYFGYDVSKTAIDICKKKFNYDKTKTFIYLNENYKINQKADLSISLDVIYHLVEDNDFNLYMKNLFESSNRYVCIYSNNKEKKASGHVRCRKFTAWIEKYVSDKWKLIKFIPNEFPPNPNNILYTSSSDFYFYEKIK